MRLIVDYSFSNLICEVFAFQAKKSDQNLKEITNKVYFDVEIAGKPAGMFYFASFEFWSFYGKRRNFVFNNAYFFLLLFF